MLMLATVLYIYILECQNVKGYDYFQSTLTTVSLRQNTFPKPSTVYRRVLLNDDHWNTSFLDLDLFANSRRKKSKGHSFLTRWDSWCQLQRRTGKCGDKMNGKPSLKYYYNLQLDQCMIFNYSGCDGNKNNFDTLTDCEQLCKGVIRTSLFVKQDAEEINCQLQPHMGVCMAIITKYYYDINEKTCKQFIYGGCGGTMNKFDAQFTCMKECAGDRV